MEDKRNIESKENKRVKTPTVLQMEIVECGAASLAMILGYYRKFVPLEQLRTDCGVTRDGVKASNIVKAARTHGMEAKGYRKEIKDLKKVKFPAIIHWNFNHFVVLEGFGKDCAYINDPADGRRKVPYEELDESFTGVVLVMEPAEEFIPVGKKPGIKEGLQKRINYARNAFVFLVILGIFMVIPGIIVPSFSKIYIDEVMLAGRMDWLKPLLLCMIAVAIFQMFLEFIQQKYLLRMETKIAMMGASSFFWHILRVPILFFQQRSVGDINSRMGSNDTVAAFLARELTENFISLVTLIFYFVVMLTYSVPLTLIALVIGLLNLVYFVYASAKIEIANKKLQQETGKLIGVSASGIYIIETLKATGAESSFFQKWAGHHAKLVNEQQKVGKISQVLGALPVFLSGIAEVAILAIGALLILDGYMTVGGLIAFQGLLGSFMQPINVFTQMGVRIKQLKADMQRLDDVSKYDIDKYSDPEKDVAVEYTEEKDFRKLEGYVQLKEISFGYNVLEEPLIKDLSIDLEPGARIALVGASGSGKSTVAKIISGIQRQWTGEILLDGENKDEISRNTITNSFAIVDQDISMFDATIMENLTMWDNTISENVVIEAAKDACIHQDIIKRQEGYGATVMEGGANFSGGQRQRLEIARALAINPSIIVMDEATSALDVRTEQIVMDNIKKRQCTCIIIAHRLSTIRDCDEILVMEKGKIVQRGKHDDMKNVEGPYQTLIKSAV